MQTTIDLAMLAKPPYALSVPVEATRTELLAAATPLNAQTENLPDEVHLPRSSAARAASVNLLNQQIGLRYKIGDYLGDVIAEHPAAVSASIAGRDTVRAAVSKAVTASLAASHAGYSPPVDAHPKVVAADAAHDQVVNYPAKAWRVSNAEIVEQLKREVGRLAG